MKTIGLILVAAMLLLVRAQEVQTVRVGATPLGEVPPLATSGFNYGNSMLVVGFEREFDAIRVDSLRFPPGNQADEIAVARHDLAALQQNLELLGRPPVLMVANLFSGTPQQASDLARLVEEMGIPVLAWEVGNEPDLYAANRSDPSWTPQRYCREFRRFSAALREVNADYRMAGPAVSGSRPAGEEYLREVLLHCGDAIDILTWHIYPTDGTGSDEAALLTSGQFGEEMRRYREWANDPASNPLGYMRVLQFGVTEFGLSWRSSSFRHLEDMTAALWLADVLGQMTRERLDVSHYFTLQGMGGHGLIDTSGWLRPTYHLYRMLGSFTGEALPVEVEAPLTGYAVRQGSETRLLLVNPSESTQSVELRFGGAVADGLEVTTLSQQIFDQLLEPQTKSSGAREPIMIPQRSIVLVRAAEYQATARP